MALSANLIWEVESGASDTLNGGGFDPSLTAGMFTDGAATSATGAAPVFSSVSYNFVTGDAGAWVYIASGSNWTPGWYKISSVGANAATLNATIGQAALKDLLRRPRLRPGAPRQHRRPAPLGRLTTHSKPLGSLLTLILPRLELD